jgi:hypothetical protein
MIISKDTKNSGILITENKWKNLTLHTPTHNIYIYIYIYITFWAGNSEVAIELYKEKPMIYIEKEKGKNASRLS